MLGYEGNIGWEATGFLNPATDNLQMGTYWIGRDASGITFDASNNLVITNQLIASAGAEATPSIGWTDTGFYEPSADQIGVSINGSLKYTIAAAGFYTTQTNGYPVILNELASATNPVYAFRGELDTGIGCIPGSDTLSLICGGTEVMRCTATQFTCTAALTIGGDLDTGGNNIIIDADGDTYWNNPDDDELYLYINSAIDWAWTAQRFWANAASGPEMRNESASATNPVWTFDADSDTGTGWAAADQLSLIAGGVEGVRITEATTITITAKGWLDRHTVATITAGTTQSQGQVPLTADINEVSVCGNANDVVTLPTAVAGRVCVVINNGAQTLQIFPASSDDLGAGVDTSTTLATTKTKRFIAYDATNWVAYADN